MKYLKKNMIFIIAIIILLFSNKIKAKAEEFDSQDEDSPLFPNNGQPIDTEPMFNSPDFPLGDFDPLSEEELNDFDSEYWGDEVWA